MHMDAHHITATLQILHESFTAMSHALNGLLQQLGRSPDEAPPALGKGQLAFMVLLCHSAGYTYQQIAAHMGVTLSTVHTHRRRLFTRFDVNSKQGLVRLGLKWGLGDGGGGLP